MTCGCSRLAGSCVPSAMRIAWLNELMPHPLTMMRSQWSRGAVTGGQRKLPQSTSSMRPEAAHPRQGAWESASPDRIVGLLDDGNPGGESHHLMSCSLAKDAAPSLSSFGQLLWMFLSVLSR